MKSFVEWVDDPDYGFMVDNTWDYEKEEWAGPGRLQLTDIQRRIFEHILTPDEDGKFPYRTIVYSTPKKNGKSTLAAAVGAWGSDELLDGSEIFVCANDKDQGKGRIFKDMRYHVEHHQAHALVKTTEEVIRYENGTFVRAIAKNSATAAGSRHALTLWDELWGYKTERDIQMWAEMTPIPTVPVSLRFIATYAGHENESDLLWDIYRKNVGKEEYEEDGEGKRIPGLEDLPCWSNGTTFIYWDHENRVPWVTPEYLEEQLNQPGTRASDYLRLHENMWVQSSEAFIPKTFVQRAMTVYEQSALSWREHPFRTFDLCVGVDAAPKRDSTAVVGVAADPKTGHTILMFDKIWTPIKGEDFDFEETVESFILHVYNIFRIVSIRHDPAHLHQTMVRLRRKNLPIEEFTQTDGNMIPASQTLFDSLKNGTLDMYHSQGLKEHLLAAVAEVKTRGYRITKKNKRSKPVDAAVALAIANYEAINRSAGAGRDPLVIQSAFPDRTAWADKMPGDDLLPPELRG